MLLRPPRSPEVRAGEVPLGVRVLPAERPESVVVSETTVVVLHVALEAWLAEPAERVFGDVTDACFHRLLTTPAPR